MWANAQHDGRPAEYRWHPVLNAAKFPGDGQTSCKVWLASVERRQCSNEAKTRKPLKLAGVPQTTGRISAASGPKFTIL